jgi:hypothetical protein
MGKTNDEIDESFISPPNRTPEEEAQWSKELNEHRKKVQAAMTDEERKQMNEFAEKLRKQDEERERFEERGKH